MHSCQLRLTKVWESSKDGNFPLQSNPSKSENLEIGGIFLQNLILSEIFWEIREFSVPIFQNQKILPKFFSIDFDQVLWAKRWQSNKIELNRSDWINGIQLAELNWTSIKIMIRPKIVNFIEFNQYSNPLQFDFQFTLNDWLPEK